MILYKIISLDYDRSEASEEEAWKNSYCGNGGCYIADNYERFIHEGIVVPYKLENLRYTLELDGTTSLVGEVPVKIEYEEIEILQFVSFVNTLLFPLRNSTYV